MSGNPWVTDDRAVGTGGGGGGGHGVMYIGDVLFVNNKCIKL